MSANSTNLSLWRASEQIVVDLGNGNISYTIRAVGYNLFLTSDDGKFHSPTKVEDGVHEFVVTYPKQDEGRQFFVGEWGYLKNPNTPAIDHQSEVTVTIVPPMPTKTIQLMVFQNCSNDDGVHFRAEVLLPDTATGSYNFEIINTNPNDGADVEKTGHNSWVIRNHDNKKNGNFKVIVTRQDCKPCVYESYSSTCNHDGQPTNCPDNNRYLEVVGGNRLYKLHDIIEFKVQNALPCDTSYYNTNLTQIGDNKYEIIGFPFKLHSQPNCGGNCHGWTEIYQATE